MIVERIWTGNSYRNFNYLIACPDTGEALAIDPLDHVKCLAAAKARGWEITQILNTHEPYLSALALRHEGAVQRRYAVQCRCRQLPPRRPSRGAVRHIRGPAFEAAARHKHLPRPRL